MSDEQTQNETPSSQPEATPSLVNQATATPKTEGEAKPEGTPKEGEPAKAPESVPLSLDDFKEIEGFDANDPHMKSYIDLMNDPALAPKDRATKLLELQREVMKAHSEKGDQAFIQMQEQWQAEIKADPEFANGKLEPALGGISKLLDRYGSAETRQAFDFTGAGNHPAIVRFLHKISSVLNEPGIDPSRINPAATPKDPASILYPNQGKK